MDLSEPINRMRTPPMSGNQWMTCMAIYTLIGLFLIIAMLVTVAIIAVPVVRRVDPVIDDASKVMEAAGVTFHLLWDIGCKPNVTHLVDLTAAQCNSLLTSF